MLFWSQEAWKTKRQIISQSVVKKSFDLNVSGVEELKCLKVVKKLQNVRTMFFIHFEIFNDLQLFRKTNTSNKETADSSL